MQEGGKTAREEITWKWAFGTGLHKAQTMRAFGTVDRNGKT
jgi:hypothetical protein